MSLYYSLLPENYHLVQVPNVWLWCLTGLQLRLRIFLCCPYEGCPLPSMHDCIMACSFPIRRTI